MRNTGSSLTSVVLAVAAAIGVGAGGYYLLAGNCSSCTTEGTAAATPVSTETKDSCCAAEGAMIETVAMTDECCAEGKTEACCEGEAAEACETACADKAEACEGKTECESKETAEVTEPATSDAGNG